MFKISFIWTQFDNCTYKLLYDKCSGYSHRIHSYNCIPCARCLHVIMPISFHFISFVVNIGRLFYFFVCLNKLYTYTTSDMKLMKQKNLVWIFFFWSQKWIVLDDKMSTIIFYVCLVFSFYLIISVGWLVNLRREYEYWHIWFIESSDQFCFCFYIMSIRFFVHSDFVLSFLSHLLACSFKRVCWLCIVLCCFLLYYYCKILRSL